MCMQGSCPECALYHSEEHSNRSSDKAKKSKLEEMADSKVPSHFVRKVALIGMPFSDKIRLLDGEIFSSYDGKYVDSLGFIIVKHTSKFDYNDKHIVLKQMIWEINTSEKYSMRFKSVSRNSQGYIVAMDNTRDETIEKLVPQIDEIEMICPEVPRIFMLSIPDINQRNVAGINWRKFKRFANGYDAESFIVSYKTGENVGEALDTLSKAFVEEFYKRSGKNNLHL